MRAWTGWIVAYLVRWLPHRAPTGLFAVGRPDAASPVLVTANFTLTLQRVRRALAGRDVWLLVANTEGINVWCAAAGGAFTTSRVVDAIKVSGLCEKVSHREVVLPALSAPGVDREAVRRETGFRCRFGPVYARDIPAYLDAGKRKSDAMRRFDFGAQHRLDMFLPMNVPVWLLVAIPLALIAPGLLPGFTVLFWGAVALLYVLLDVIPGKTGWAQALLVGSLVAAAWAGIDAYSLNDPLAHGGRWIAVLAVFFVAGFDVAGTISPRTSDAERLMHRLGVRRIGAVFTAKETGEIRLDRLRCRGCLTCAGICPVGVFAGLGENGQVTSRDAGACFACGACVKQCPETALSLAARE
jgi:ferredoxin